MEAGAAAAGVGIGASECAVYIAIDDGRPQRKPSQLITSKCTAVASALHELAALVAWLHDESAEGGMGQAEVHPPLQVHVAGVHGDALKTCNAQLAAVAVTHCMLAW